MENRLTMGTKPYGYGNETSKKKTLEAAVTSAGKINCERFYAVGIGLPNSINIYTHDDEEKWKHDYYTRVDGIRELVQMVELILMDTIFLNKSVD